ncbi:MAG: hypothetical protein ACE5E7_16635 [Anaerolineae bacterium]
MSHNRLGTLCAGLLGLGWLAAVAINLIFWFPQVQALGPEFWDDGQLFLAFVRDNAVTWKLFHLGATIGLAGLILLIPLLAELDGQDTRRQAFTAVGLVGAVFVLLATLIDFLGTPVLARLAAGDLPFVEQIWQFMEPWRDAGLKTLSYWFLGIWALWVGGRWRLHDELRLGRFSQVMAAALLLLALIETAVPRPFVYALGETGLGGVAFLLLPIWGLWTAHWFWQRELADVNG